MLTQADFSYGSESGATPCRSGLPEKKTIREKPKGRITIRTVAADAGVSVAAVSKVLRDAYGVSDEMRQKVNGVISRLGYRPSKPARGLRGRTFTIGILLVDIENPFLPQIIGGIHDELRPSNYQAMIGVGGAQVILETSLIDSMIDHKMDGLILVAPRLPPELIEDFARQIPIVAIGYHFAEAVGFDTINADDQKGAELAVDALAAAGHRDIAMYTLGAPEGHKVSVVRQREIGYRRAMERLGLGAYARQVEVPVQSVADANRRREIIAELLARRERPEAIFCWSDLDAIQILAAARQLGIRVPDDLAVVGFDDSPIASNPMFDLASIDQSGSTLGRLATKALLSRLDGRVKAEHTYIEPRFIRRGSL
jgi:LacI family transcriptional regulator